jgi:HSP20 family protein
MDDPTNLFGDIKRAHEEMEQLMRQVFGQTFPLMRPLESKWRPNVDVFECEDRVVAIAELAGVSREDVSVTFDDGKLHISGIRKDDAPYTCRKYCQMEINYNEFERTVYLPENIDADRITAKLNNGFMIIEAPKKNPEPPKSQQIQIA